MWNCNLHIKFEKVIHIRPLTVCGVHLLFKITFILYGFFFSTVDLRTRWSNLNDDKKFWYGVLMVILLFLLVADVQNENGLFQLITWPICKTMLTILYEILRCLFYIPYRPVFGVIRCAIEVLWILVDIVINTILCVMNIATVVLLLPANLMNSLGILIPSIAQKVKLFLPVILFMYIVIPNFQQWCRDMLVRLQRNNPVQ